MPARKGVDVGLIDEFAYRRHLAFLVCVIERVAHLHNEVVLIGIAQQWIVGSNLADELILHFGQVDVVDVEQVERVSDHAAALGPLVFPSGTGNHAGVFRTLLIGERCGELGVGADFLSETLLQERKDEFGEGDAYLAVVFGIFVVYQPRHIAGDALIVDACLGGERLGAARKVAVLVCRRHAESKVALGVGALRATPSRSATCLR